jgi:hypothetical protein
MLRTNEGAIQYEHTLDHLVECFSKIGSIRKNSFYGNQESAVSLFQKAWIVDKYKSFQILLWLRDRTDGAGSRQAFKDCLQWLAEYDPQWVKANLSQIPELGRWDDLRVLFGTSLEDVAVNYWVSSIMNDNVLAAKWADRKDIPLRKKLGMNEAQFRKMLANIRKGHIVEHKMCQKKWESIDYSTVPSVAMARYAKAFSRNDGERFGEYINQVKQGTAKVNTSVLFPHDCVRTATYGNSPDLADQQFENLPNFMEGTDEKIMVICDSSGSMSKVISGKIRAVDVAMGLSLYCSSKVSKDSPFYKKFIGFCSEGSFKDWNGLNFSQALRDRSIFDGAIGSTRIDKALDLILKTATFFKLSQDQLPTTLLIISDMQFHEGTSRQLTPYFQRGYNIQDNIRNGVKGTDTEVNRCLNEFVKVGYQKPKVVYWNTAGYSGSPEIATSKNVGLISGFSPSVLSAVLKGEKFDPISIMERTLEKYEVVIPHTG